MPKKKSSTKRSGLLSRLHAAPEDRPGHAAGCRADIRHLRTANLHLAIAELLQQLPEPPDLFGVVSQREYDTPRLAKLCAATVKYYGAGPVEYTDVPLADGQQLACVKCGLYFVREAEGPLTLLLTEDRFHRSGIIAEINGAGRGRPNDSCGRLTGLSGTDKRSGATSCPWTRIVTATCPFTSTTCRQSTALLSSCRRNCSGALSGIPSVSPGTPTNSARPAAT